jgi:hypothetical protein
MDVFIFPATLVELYPNMTDGTPKRIALTPMTKLVIAGTVTKMHTTAHDPFEFLLSYVLGNLHSTVISLQA